jgi:glucose/arabinose dehydrogenase
LGKVTPVPHSRYAAIAIVATTLVASPGSAQIALTQVGVGFSQPLFVTAPTDEPNRLYVVEKGGTVRTLNTTGGVNAPDTMFLDLPAQLAATGGGTVLTGSEQGLLGMAFAPGYTNRNGFVYVDYIGSNGTTQGQTRVDRFTVAGGSIVAGSRVNILTFDQNVAGQTNHKGGWIGFGPDNLLYIATGDGGSANDPMQNAQSLTVLLGKMLRIAPSTTVGVGGYTIPAANPFAGNTSGFRQEIFAYGLRNSFRNSFDRLTGDLYIGDVGQGAHEEVNFVKNNGGTTGLVGGQNFGWRKYEGNSLTAGISDTLPNAMNVIFPILDYSHANGDDAITGGYVYRGGDILDHGQSLDGTYIFGDFVSGRIFSFRYDGTGVVGTVTDRTAEMNSINILGANGLSSFGEDNVGRLYAVDIGGQIYRITGAAVPEPGTLALTAAVAGGWLWRRIRRTE